MSRAYRKLMRERDGLVPLAVQPKQNTNSLNPDNEVTTDEEGEGDSQHPAGGQQSLFALLGGDDVDSDESDEEGADSDTAKGLKAATTTAAATVNGQDNDEDDAEDDEEEERIGKPAAKRKSKKKKNKKKGKGGGKEVVVENEGKGKGKGKAVEDGMDEIDRTLRELNEKFGDILTPTSTEPTNPNNTDSARRDLLSIDPRWLDADAEMRKMFGSRVVNDEIRRKKYIRSAKRTALAVPREHWPKPDKLGLTMELESTADDGTLYFTFVHSRAYQEIQHVFIQCVNTHDPNTIQNLLQMYPYHIDTLLQLSEIAKHGGDIAMAAELVERALYAFERAFHSMFNAATGLARLPYQRFENRAFHLALFRHIGYLARRGCWRTSFEFAKFLLALDIDADPLGTLYSIDAYALNAKEEEWYLRFVDAYQESLGLLDYPNHAYSLALAKWAVEAKNHKSSSSSLHAESTTLLHTAIRTFPTLIPLLLDKCGSSVAGVTPDTPFFVDETDSLALRLQVELYVERAHSMWKVPEVLAWLREGVKSVLAEGGERGSGVGEGEVPRNLSRHIFISDFPNITSALPRTLASTDLQSHDPLPPPSTTSRAPTGLSLDFTNPVTAAGGGLRTALAALADQIRRLRRGDGDGDGDDLGDLDPGNGLEEEENEEGDWEDEWYYEERDGRLTAGRGRGQFQLGNGPGQVPEADWMAGFRAAVGRLRPFAGWDLDGGGPNGGDGDGEIESHDGESDEDQAEDDDDIAGFA